MLHGSHRRSRRGVAPVFGVLLLVTITIILTATLYQLRIQTPQAVITLSYAVNTQGSEPTWGDGSDCKNVGTVQTCQTLPTINIIFPDPPAALISQILFTFYCNGSVYLQATLAQMAWVPGSTGTVGSTGPQLQNCGTFVPQKAAWNRFAFFEQEVPGSTALHPGDTLVVYAHTFTTFKDDDFHGAPLFCYDTPGACTLQFLYTGTPPSLAASIPLLGMYN